MKFAVFSDLHANQYAISAVGLDAIEEMEVDEGNFWCLGDVVGYGPHPVVAIRFLRHLVDQSRWVMGNHDAMLADLLTEDDLLKLPKDADVVTLRVQGGKGQEVKARGFFQRPYAWKQTTNMPVTVILRNRAALAEAPDEDNWWRQAFTIERTRPLFFNQNGIHCILVHGAQSDNLSRYLYAWHKEIYIRDEYKVLREHYGADSAPVIQFSGHTHVPMFVRIQKDDAELEIEAEKVVHNKVFQLDDGYTYLVNPGSVGQPRDRDPRASYLVFDSEERTITFRRVAYDYEHTALDLRAEDYPPSLIKKLLTAAADEENTPNDWLNHYDQASKR